MEESRIPGKNPFASVEKMSKLLSNLLDSTDHTQAQRHSEMLNELQ